MTVRNGSLLFNETFYTFIPFNLYVSVRSYKPIKKKVMRKYILFAFNYKSDFISEVWENDPRMIEHLKEKFAMFQERKSSSIEALMNFLAELDEGNLKRVEDYIEKNS